MNDMQHQVALAVLGSALGLASVLLVFVAFVYGKSEGIGVVARGRQYRNVARGGFIPFALSMITGWIALTSLQSGAVGTYDLAVIGLQASMVATGVYAFVVVFLYL